LLNDGINEQIKYILITFHQQSRIEQEYISLVTCSAFEFFIFPQIDNTGLSLEHWDTPTAIMLMNQDCIWHPAVWLCFIQGLYKMGNVTIAKQSTWNYQQVYEVENTTFTSSFEHAC